MKKFVIIIAVMLMVGYGAKLALVPAETPRQAAADAASFKQLEDAERLGLAAKAAVLAQLKDPDSAQFVEVQVTDTGVVCGLVNAKNSFGGFVGPTHFLDDHGFVLLNEGAGAKNFVAYWKMVCNKPGREV
jgi:hypothetical protein